MHSTMASQRCVLLVDGSNLFFKLRNLGLSNLLQFDFAGFGAYLAGEHTLIRAGYYIGEIRRGQSEQSQRLYDDQQRLLSHLLNHGWYYRLGYLLRSDGVFHEKGVDVHLAVDMLVAAFKEPYERIILVSSDTDLIPAIEQAKVEGKHIEYVGFAHKPSFALVRTASSAHLLAKQDVLAFISPR